MKKIAKTIVLGISVFLMVLLTGCADNSFASIVDSELFASVPMMASETVNFSEVEDVGGGNYQIWAYDTSLSEYKAYLALLEEEGFEKYVDNGEDGIEGYVYTSHYMKDNLLVVVTYYTQLEDATITVCEDAILSEHLFYSDEYVADNKSGAKTTLTMPELYLAGNSFVFQLKNGHFIVNDGGDENDLPYLLDYLESLTPEGEKPVIEAWIITHSHQDHVGVFVGFSQHKEWCKRIYVDNVYFTEASVEAHEDETTSISALTFYSKSIPTTFKTSDDGVPGVYRMREGERYYFNDITMDVVYEQAMLSHEEWKTWNATSTALMYTIEGQKILMTADMDYECQMLMLDVFPDEYFNLTVYSTPHHGGNVYNQFSSHLTLDTALYTAANSQRDPSGLQGRYTQSLFLQSKVKEALCWLEGGVKLTFPYEVGTYERLPLIDWIYNKELPTRLQQ